MDNHSQVISHPDFINGLVAAVLDDAVKPPIRFGSRTRLEEIRHAVIEGNATIDMAIDIVASVPKHANA